EQYDIYGRTVQGNEYRITGSSGYFLTANRAEGHGDYARPESHDHRGGSNGNGGGSGRDRGRERGGRGGRDRNRGGGGGRKAGSAKGDSRQGRSETPAQAGASKEEHVAGDRFRARDRALSAGTTNRWQHRWETLLLTFWRPLEHTRLGSFAATGYLELRAVARGYRGERIALRAGSLTYITLFSLIPITSLALGILHRLGDGRMEAAFRHVIFSLLAPGVRDEGAAFLSRFLEAVGSRAVGSVGLLL